MNIKTTVSETYDDGWLELTFDTRDNTVSIETCQDGDHPNMLRIKMPLLKHLKYMIEQLDARIYHD